MFAECCKTTARLFVSLYAWYNMLASLNRILIHGSEIIKASPLPAGMFSEEAIESRNKDFRRYREFFSRKFSREKAMEDMFCRLLVSSDPYIFSISECVGARRNKEPLMEEIPNLLQESNLQKVLNADSKETNSDEDTDIDDDDSIENSSSESNDY